jgi:hypothetical protein
MDFWASNAHTREHFRKPTPELEAEGERLRADLAAIEAAGDEDACRLCGNPGPLTVEHAPSRAAGNDVTLVGGRIDDEATMSSGEVRWATDVSGGATFPTLCTPCNNNTGQMYNPSYVTFVLACRPLAIASNAGCLCQLRVARRPLVAKQALTSLVATSQPGLTARYPVLRDLLLTRAVRRPIHPLRLWCYLMAGHVGMYTGVTASINVLRMKGRLIAGFAFWPVGWVLTLEEGEVVTGALDVSGWLELDRDREPVTVEVPCQWANLYPGDFRRPDEVLREAAADTIRHAAQRVNAAAARGDAERSPEPKSADAPRGRA